MTPTRDDFARWRDDPVTRYVMWAHEKMAGVNRDEWIKISWDNGVANEAALRELRIRADAYLAIVEMTYEGVCDANGDQPNEE